MNQQNNEVSLHVWNHTMPDGRLGAVLTTSDDDMILLPLESLEALIHDATRIRDKIKRNEK